MKIDTCEGQAMISFLFILNIFFVALMVLSLSGIFLKNKTQSLAACRSELIGIQKNMKLKMTMLKALNPAALMLRLEKIKTQAMLAAATLHGNIPAIASLTAKLKVIIAKQELLANKQNVILNSAYLGSAAKLGILRGKLIRKGTRLTVPYAKALKLKKEPENEIAPSYKTYDGFTQAQKISATWYEDPLKNIPVFIKKVFTDLPLVKEGCSASLKEVNGRWKSVLI